MPPPKPPVSSERPPTDSTPANRMIQAALNINPKKKVVKRIIKRRGQTPDQRWKRNATSLNWNETQTHYVKKAERGTKYINVKTQFSEKSNAFWNFLKYFWLKNGTISN